MSNSLLLTLSSLCGAVLGLSAPGFGQWYLAWIGLVPLFLLISSSKTAVTAIGRGLLFGFGYNLVALSWFLKMSPPWWIAIEVTQHLQWISVVVWILAALLHGSAYALLALAVRAALASPRAKMPVCLVALPAVWALTTHVLFNQPDLLLVPLSVLEYSQYRQLPLVQICSVIGGSGLEALIVSFNVALAMSLSNTGGALRPAAPLVSLVVLLTAGWGQTRQNMSDRPSPLTVSVVQGDFTRKYDSLRRSLTTDEVWSECKQLLNQCPPGIVIFTETVLPDSALGSEAFRMDLEKEATNHRSDFVIGAWERTDGGATYNAAIAVSERQGLSEIRYRKRYLMPFGEFEPLALRCLPPSLKRAWHVPSRQAIACGSGSVALPSRAGDIAAVICGESFDSALCANSVTPDTALIANLSNLTWFRKSTISSLEEAIAVIRALENERAYIYSSDTGPSFIVNPYGRTLARSNWCEATVISAVTPLSYDVTPYTRLCHFINGCGFRMDSPAVPAFIENRETLAADRGAAKNYTK